MSGNGKSAGNISLPLSLLAVGKILTLAFLALQTGCAPVFSDLQSARLVGPGRTEVTPSYSSVQVSDDGEYDRVQDHFGLQVARGISDRWDLRARYEYIDLDGDGVSVLGFGPKYGIVEDRLAFFAPVGFAFGSDIDTGETFQIQPTLLFTQPFNQYLEVTTGAKALLWFDRSNDDLVAANLGLGLSQDLEKWALRPEVGVLKNPGEDGTYWHFSLGVTFFTGAGHDE